VAKLPATREPQIDPKKWSLDPDTGEYYPVTFIGKDGTLVRTITYEERRVAYLKGERSLVRSRKLLIYIAVITVVLASITEYLWRVVAKQHPIDIVYIGAACFTIFPVTGGLAFVCEFVSWLRREYHFAGAKERDVGPRPVAQRYDAGDGNVHGEGGFATREDIDRAAQGITRGAASQQEFED